MSQAPAIIPIAVSIEESTRYSGHTRSATYEAIARGDLVSFKSGKRRLILIKELEVWLNRMAKENAR
ncbi:helix-turn-helix domain-containing protein [Pseudomonas aeruginosa]|uniref:helix-turn-helix domain-containing protein n=1 Tax=Pseudomonas aeruginosa TaxID=287 RepID=UPI000F52886B|nr:helix-turn-helix domain-containing protein [Pseudomonas aeruginosa]RPZ02162.1 DNA-binding protein [Pseudomonas aeruginosa]WOA84052.1 helix-turn-helix domain-containing protein [Pseudomonas aeruginosa]